MVLKGVKAQFAKDKSTVTTWAYPSKSGYPYKLTKKTWKNKCPFCGGTFKFNPKGVAEGELTCTKCDADFCCVSGKDKAVKVRKTLTPATVTSNSASTVASSQTQSQKCSLSKAQALTKAKKELNTSSSFKATLEIPILDNLKVGDLCQISFNDMWTEKTEVLFVDSIKEDIDNQKYTLELLQGKNHFGVTYDGGYIFKNKNGAVIGNSNNPLNAKCENVNINIGLKDSSEIGKKIQLKGQELGTVPNIYKWLKVKTAGGTGGWKYKKYGDHIVKSEDKTKFGAKSAKKCWGNKTANCVDFAWIMSKLGEGAGKKIGIRRGTYTQNGKTSGHMWNTYNSKNYDCSSSTTKTIEFKKVESIK